MCAAEIVGNPSPQPGDWVVDITLLNEAGQVRAESGKKTLVVAGIQESLDGLGVPFYYRNIGDAKQGEGFQATELEMSYNDEPKWLWSQCAERKRILEDQNNYEETYRYCRFECRDQPSS